MSVARVAAVVRFEVRRTATLPRLMWWAALAFFPVVIVSLLVGFGAPVESRDAWTVILFTLIPVIVCMMGLLLWATPVVNAEVEGNTWPYLAVRPHGKTSVLLGKYITAVAWTALAGWTGLAVSLGIARPERAFHIGTVLALLVLISSVSYGALFTFLGVLAHKRPMVVTVAYALILELLVGWIPAMINQFTIQLRLRTLAYTWIDWREPLPPESLNIFTDTGSATRHVLVLAAVSIILVAASVWLLRQKTLVTSSDV